MNKLKKKKRKKLKANRLLYKPHTQHNNYNKRQIKLNKKKVNRFPPKKAKTNKITQLKHHIESSASASAVDLPFTTFPEEHSNLH